jgi:hypothetical protein
LTDGGCHRPTGPVQTVFPWRDRVRPGEDTHLIRRLSWVAFFLEVGLLLVILPWSEFWDHNYFAVTLPPVRSVVTNNFVRGGVTGLGVVNLVIGLAELALVITTRDRGAEQSGTE